MSHRRKAFQQSLDVSCQKKVNTSFFSFDAHLTEVDKRHDTQRLNVGVTESDVDVFLQDDKFVVSNGDTLDLVFCDVFEFEQGLIKKLTSYVTGKTPE